MDERRPGTYYVPYEGMRYWDGETWSESEPRSHDTEAAVAAEKRTANRPARDHRLLPWLVAGIAVIRRVWRNEVLPWLVASIAVVAEGRSGHQTEGAVLIVDLGQRRANNTERRKAAPTCTNCGRANVGTARFCSACGHTLTGVPVGPDNAVPSARYRVSRRSPTKAVIAAGTVALALVAGLLIYQATRSETYRVMVALSDNPSGDSDCSTTSYSAQYLVGTNLTLRLADGTIAGVERIQGDGAGGAGSCTWFNFMEDVPDSPAYTLEIDGPAVTQTVNYSRAEMAAHNWNIALEKNF